MVHDRANVPELVEEVCAENNFDVVTKKPCRLSGYEEFLYSSGSATLAFEGMNSFPTEHCEATWGLSLGEACLSLLPVPLTYHAGLPLLLPKQNQTAVHFSREEIES